MTITCPNCRGGGALWDDIDRRNETCHLCDGTGHVDSETFESVQLNRHGRECGCEMCVQDYDME